MGPVDILCVNTAVKTDTNAVIQCHVTPTCSHVAIVKEPENVELRSVKIDFNNLDQKYSCVPGFPTKNVNGFGEDVHLKVKVSQLE